MKIEEPRWLRYAVYQQVNGFPMLIGLKKDTPKDIIEEFKKDQKAYQKMREKGLI